MKVHIRSIYVASSQNNKYRAKKMTAQCHVIEKGNPTDSNYSNVVYCVSKEVQIHEGFAAVLCCDSNLRLLPQWIGNNPQIGDREKGDTHTTYPWD